MLLAQCDFDLTDTQPYFFGQLNFRQFFFNLVTKQIPKLRETEKYTFNITKLD